MPRLGQFAGQRSALFERSSARRGLVACLRAAQRRERTGAVRDCIRVIQREKELALGNVFSGPHVEMLHGGRRRSMSFEVVLRLNLAVGAVGRDQILHGRLRHAQRQLLAGESAHREEDDDQQDCGERPQDDRFRSAIFDFGHSF